MTDRSDYQKKVIERYYDQRDAIMLNRLQELVTELYLADSEKKREQLWKRVQAAMENLGVKPRLMEHILSRRSAETLAQNVRDWLRAAGQTPRKG
jgi:ubiquinone biosynthesis protein COQ9